MLSQHIFRIVPQLMRIIRNLAGDQLQGSITVQQLRVLFLVSEGMGQSQMAHVLQISMPAVSKAVHGLTERGLILCRPGLDKRSLQLTLTSKGKKTLSTVSSEVESELEKKLDKLGAAEKRDLEKGLQVLDKLLMHFKED